MRILLFPRQSALLRHHEDVFLGLVGQGHALEVALPASLGEGLRPPLAGVEGITEVLYEEGFDAETARALRLLRLTRDYLRFLEPPLDQAFVNRERVLAKMAETLGAEGTPPLLPARLDRGGLAAAKD